MANLEIGIIGVTGCGKSAVAAALTAGHSASQGASSKAHLAIAHVPDPRLAPLAATVSARKVTPATMQLVDLPGITTGPGAARANGEILGQIRQVDALIHVVRCFNASGVEPDPMTDLENVGIELVVADREHVERQIKAARTVAKSGGREALVRVGELEQFAVHLDDGNFARSWGAKMPEGLDLLTDKPVLYVANTDEDGSADAVALVTDYAAAQGGRCVPMCAQLEAEIASLDPEDAQAFMQEMGMESSSLERVALEAFELLDLITFFTVGEKETRAWLVRQGSDAVVAAGKIHSDIARGFIRAEVIDWSDLVELGSHSEASRAGKMRLEGKTYTVRDGDVLNVRFNI